MVIASFITTHKHKGYSGKGGHYHSFLHINSTLKEHIDLIPINIGREKPDIYSHLDGFIHVQYQYNIYKLINNIIQVIETNSVDVVHCYDQEAAEILSMICFIKRLPLVVTKCGGRNIKSIIHGNHLVLFSHENYEFYNNKVDADISLIPNRLKSIKTNEERLSKFTEKVGRKDRSRDIYLRVNRICEKYKDTMKMAIDYISDNKKKNSILVVIGYEDGDEIVQQIKKYSIYKQVDLMVLTSNEFTENANIFYSEADYIIATGRGVMEASYFNKKILVPTIKGLVPLNDYNLKELFKYNFSERSKTDSVNNSFEENTIKYFNQLFSTDNVVADYIEIYNKCGKEKVRLCNARQFYGFLKYLYRNLIRRGIS